MDVEAEHEAKRGNLRIALVITSILAVLSTSCTESSPNPSNSPTTATQSASTVAATGGAPSSCTDVVDGTVVAIQDFLDRLGDVSTDEVPLLEPVEVWLEAYADLHRGIARLEAFVSDDISDENFEELADSMSRWQGVSATKALSKDQAIAHARELFADNPEMLEVLNDDPSIIPRSIQLTIDEAQTESIYQRLDATPGITQTSERFFRVPMLAVGVFGVGVAEPYLRQPTADAERLGCTDDLLMALKSRSDEFEPRGSAGEAFIEGLRP